MNYSKSFLMHTLLALLILTAIVFCCYYYVDKPLAYWVYNHHIPNPSLRYLTTLPLYFYVASPILLILSVLLTSLGGNNPLLQCAFNAAMSLIITRFMADISKFVFGRYWPLTWSNNNPSLIKHKAYGFHFFHLGKAYQSFPSGHVAMTFAFLTAFCLHYPKLFIPSALLCIAIVIGVLGMDYNFASDVIAGAFLGSLIAIMVVKR